MSTTTQTVRVRYAPSPTGEPHIGNLRTALFNWLFARRHGGAFIVRIEDTDVDRNVAKSVDTTLEALRWLGMDWDEGPDKGGPHRPYFQSQRLHLYNTAAEKLVKEGKAYYCYCSPERLDALRRQQQAEGKPPGYDRHCRDLPAHEHEHKQAEGTPHVVRFKVPLQGETTFNDLIRGPVTVRNELLDDFVLVRSGGFPTYHLAHLVDDHHMHITHVMRADEWLSSTPRHILLYQALGYVPPAFAHLPIILGPDKSKLSKRHGATSVLAYREMGYLPETLVNFMALLGWSLDDKTEVIPRDVLITNFSLERVGKAGAIFNIEKLTWLNGVYIRQLSAHELADRLLPFLEKLLPPDVPRPIDIAYLHRIVPLIQERLKTLAEGPELTDCFFLESLKYDSSLLVQKGIDKTKTLLMLNKALEAVSSIQDFNAPDLEQTFRRLGSELNFHTREFFGTVRVALTGRTATPPLFQTMEVLGKDRCVSRLKAAVQKLSQPD